MATPHSLFVEQDIKDCLLIKVFSVDVKVFVMDFKAFSIHIKVFSVDAKVFSRDVNVFSMDDNCSVMGLLVFLFLIKS